MSKKLLGSCAALALLVGVGLIALTDNSEPTSGIGISATGDGGGGQPSADYSDREGAAVPGEDRVAVDVTPPLGSDPASAAELEPGSLLIRVRRASGDPLAGVELYIKRDPRAEAWDGLARLRTDAAGELRLAELPPGTLRVGPLRDFYDNHRDVVVEAGREALCELIVADGITVRGVVLDEHGHPVAGADIWVATGMRHWLGGEIVGRSDDVGVFAFDGIDPGTGIGAIAPGFERSSVIDLDRVVKRSDVAEIELRLTSEGGAVTGWVLDPEGQPVEGAWVAVGAPVDYFEWHGTGDSIVERWTPLTARTGEDGAFAIHGLPLATHPVEVRAEGFALWKDEVDLVETAVVPLQIRLVRGFSIVGAVRNVEGEPVEAAVVRAYDRELDLDFVQGGQFDYNSAFGFAKTRTDAQGEYRIDHLQLVPIHLWATPAVDPRREDGTAVIRDHAVVEGFEGAVVRWDATLSEGLVLHGRVTYSDGEAMENVFVTARHEASGVPHTLVTGRRGDFRFTNMAEGAHALGVQLWDPPQGAAPVEAVAVFPGPDPVLLVADFPKPVEREPCAVTGHLVDEARRLEDPSQLRVILRWKASFTWNESATYEGTRFTFEDIDPGEYRVCAFSGDTLIQQGEWFEVLPGETKDLGDLRTSPGGTILLTIDRSALPTGVRPRYSTGKQGAIDWSDLDIGVEMPVRLDNLEPGVHVISVSGQGLVRVEEEVLVEPGETVRMTFVLRAAVRREFSIDWPAHAELGFLQTWIFEGDGTMLWDLKETNTGALPRPYERWTRLPLGDFVLKAETGSGLTGAIEFSVTDLAGDQEWVQLSLQ